MPSYSWKVTLLLLGGVYYYSHYFFASVAAHVSSMYSAFFVLAISTGAPPYISALFLAFCSNLFGGLTHYSSGPAPILFAQGHVELKKWWQAGFAISLYHLIIWTVIGGLWWNYIGIL